MVVPYHRKCRLPGHNHLILIVWYQVAPSGWVAALILSIPDLMRSAGLWRRRCAGQCMTLSGTRSVRLSTLLSHREIVILLRRWSLRWSIKHVSQKSYQTINLNIRCRVLNETVQTPVCVTVMDTMVEEVSFILFSRSLTYFADMWGCKAKHWLLSTLLCEYHQTKVWKKVPRDFWWEVWSDHRAGNRAAMQGCGADRVWGAVHHSDEGGVHHSAGVQVWATGEWGSSWFLWCS